MSERMFLELVANLKYGPDTWEGTGYWPLPSNPDDTAEVFVVACKAVVRGLKRLITVPTRPALSIAYRVVLMGGSTAARIDARSAKLPMDDAGQVIWQPVGRLEAWRVKDE